MKRLLESYSDGIYAAMRVVLGLLFWCHGAQKAFGILGDQSQDLASLLGVAGLIGVIGGVLIAAGLFTTYTAFLSSGLVAVGYFLAHFPLGFVPIQNGGELAVVYAFCVSVYRRTRRRPLERGRPSMGLSRAASAGEDG